jgi:methionyl aminopeptidase
MRNSNHSPFANNSLVTLKDNRWLEKQRIAGKIVAASLNELEWYCKNKTFHSMATLNDMIEKFIIKEGGIPTFKGYKKTGQPDFPAGVCVSINKALVHGIPDDTVLNDGDVVSFDLGVTYDGAIADSALTVIFGSPLDPKHVLLLKTTEEALMQGIGAIAIGKHLGCIGHAISKYTKNKGFGLVNNYGGHGLDWNVPHAPPFVANKSEPTEGIRIQPGLSIAIEPMLTIGDSTTKTLSDGWTVVTPGIGAHFEHSIFVHRDCVEIVTWRDDSEYPKQIPFKIGG